MAEAASCDCHLSRSLGVKVKLHEHERQGLLHKEWGHLEVHSGSEVVT